MVASGSISVVSISGHIGFSRSADECFNARFEALRSPLNVRKRALVGRGPDVR
jgi:hypothetical protein